jgi:hypothetical protein
MILACLWAHSGAAVGSVCPVDTGRHFANFTVENRHALRLYWGASVNGPATSMIGVRLEATCGSLLVERPPKGPTFLALVAMIILHNLCRHVSPKPTAACRHFL